MNPLSVPNQTSEACSDCVIRRMQVPRRHWLLDAVYGRELLKAKLRQVRPDLPVPTWRERPELDPLLDQMIEMLGLRGWEKPRTLKERWRYLCTVLQMAVGVRCGSEPDAV